MPLKLGARQYRLRGYCANRFASGLDHEPHLMPLIARELCKKNGAFVDIGTNVGQTLVKVLALDPTRRYVGFEPQISCCFFVEQFLKDNALTRAQVIPLALFDVNRVCSLYSNDRYDEMASLSGAVEVSGRKRQSVTLVPCRIGDEVLDEIGLEEIAAIKIDVEGTELQVLTGLAQTLHKKQPAVIFEVLPNFYGHDRLMQDSETCSRNTSIAERLYKYLSDAGYEIRQINRCGDEIPIHKFDLDNRIDYIGSDYIASPRR